MFSKKISLFLLPFMTLVSLQANDPVLNDPFGDDIFKEMYQMQKEMDKIFERMHERMNQRTKLWNYPTKQTFIPGNRIRTESLLEDKGTYYEYHTQIPENKNNQIDISISDGVLHLKATVETMKKSDDANMKMQQRYVSMIQRSETLPPDTDARSLKSEYKNGLLVLTLQKKQSLTEPEGNLKEEKKPQERSKKEDQKEKIENNATKIKVPHTSSQV
ncbi:Hsp20/alpha crystallin family protein [Sulfurovum sp. XGS-02]|uniref:Hsp20/alpha crystallin family protein n=1 Tax=Sulfurovum sp. XGS-02 TaxID=2925411 RepID=UPI002058A5BE|nr:Hsp20/alpha crystallin family protein [Sulfurovum sp. XGS-02]UPT78566.1 Hsp20/alpha crystallin family protein [Sulfurovum sp. XGS-02]